MQSQTAAIQSEALTKRFGKFTAVEEVSFEVEPGEVFGLLGPNGAGKTTLIRMLTTLLVPTSGRGFVAGHDIARSAKKVRAAIGVIPQALTSDLDLTAWENLDIYGEFYDVPRHERHERAHRLLEMVGLKERANDLVATFSGGMRRRLEIARGLIHSPEVLFLDEPTIGLDPQSRRVVWEFLERLRNEVRLTISLTTHYMDEAEQLCDRIAIIDGGKIIALDTPDGLKSAVSGGDRIELELDHASEEVIDDLRAQAYIRDVGHNGNGKLVLATDDGAQAIPLVIDRVSSLGRRVKAITLHELSLEDVFIHFTGHSLRDEPAKKVNFLVGAGMPSFRNR